MITYIYIYKYRYRYRYRYRCRYRYRYYAHLASVRFEHSVFRGSLMTNHIMLLA